MLLNSYIYTGTFYGPLSVRINGVDCLDLQDLAGGGGGGGGWGGRLGPQQSCPVTFNFVP